MSPDSETELCGSGTRPPEWEPDNTADVMIGMCTGSHRHQHGTTVCVKIIHVIKANTIHSTPLDEQRTMVCEWNTHYLSIGQDYTGIKCEQCVVCGTLHYNFCAGIGLYNPLH